MHLISNFKDYYDFLIGKYGIDPNIFFKRTKLSPTYFYKINCPGLPSAIYSEYPHNEEETIYFNWLVICGKLYLTSSKGKEEKLVTNDDIKDKRILNEIFGHLHIKERFEYYLKRKEKRDFDIEKFYGIYEKDMIKVHKETKSPIFKITRVGMSYDKNSKKYVEEIYIDDDSPILKNIKGIPSLLKPDDLYKDLVYFIGNVINNNPDPSKIDNISNKDKIIKGGFDYITSFRNM